MSGLPQKEILERERAVVEADVEEVFAPRSQIRLIVMSHESLTTYQSQLKSIKIPVVDQEWISACILHNRFLQPERYSIIPDQQNFLEKVNFTITLEHVESIIEKLESSDRMMSYLMNCVVYISKIGEKEERLQQRLIHMGGGAHMMTIIPNITHIVSDKYSEEQAREFYKFSNVFIVSTRWLKDCLHFKTRVPEIEYVIKPSKKTDLLDQYFFLTQTISYSDNFQPDHGSPKVI